MKNLKKDNLIKEIVEYKGGEWQYKIIELHKISSITKIKSN